MSSSFAGVFDVRFGHGRAASAIRLGAAEELDQALVWLGLQPSRPTIVLVGGAAALGDDDLHRLRPLFEAAIVPAAAAAGAFVVDGGTDVGVIRLMGTTRADQSATFPLIGVAAVGTVALPGEEAEPHGEALEPHHTHFLLVPGSRWGDECRWLARTATRLSLGKPSLTILVNGGEISLRDVRASIEEGRPVLAIGRTGRLAERVVREVRGHTRGALAAELVDTGLIRAVVPQAGFESVRQAINDALAAG
ncbi:MAG TPA: hypothetical protein VHF25_07770 [Nitriliruptorales bacterium]|nr:hypothetical protein [Nitriliruptorales bacterium]